MFAQRFLIIIYRFLPAVICFGRLPMVKKSLTQQNKTAFAFYIGRYLKNFDGQIVAKMLSNYEKQDISS